MCDTLLIPPAWTSSRKMILAKNSDREPNEAQAIERHPARLCTEKELQCTAITIPQAEKTFEILISRPFHIWGAEMGVNEHGLAIGNEAVFTNVPIEKKNIGLTGMDLLRLALERAENSRQAIEVITHLLEQFGQDACGGYTNRNMYYHNSFFIADPLEAWHLETAGRYWVAKRVTEPSTISNRLSIGSEFELAHATLETDAVKKGWVKSNQTFNFARIFSDKFFTTLSRSLQRQSCSLDMLQKAGKSINPDRITHVLASHLLPDSENENPAITGMDSLCIHASGLLTPAQTNGSMIAELDPEGNHRVWFTGTSLPCLSVYKPFFFGTGTLLPGGLNTPGEKQDQSLWWESERLHRAVLRNYRELKSIFNAQKNDWQSILFSKAEEFSKSSLDEKARFEKDNLEYNLFLVKRWMDLVEQSLDHRWNTKNLIFRLYRNRLDKIAGIEF